MPAPLVLAGIAAASGTGQGIANAKAGKRQFKNQKELMKIQQGYNQQNAALEQKLALDMWDKTNYSAQRKQMLKAGLNPAMMYEKGGTGGTTSGAGNVASGGAPTASMPIPPNLAGLGLTGMQIVEAELMKAQANKANAEAKKIGGVDTELAESTIQKILAETTNEQAKTGLIELEKESTTIDNAWKPYILEQEFKELVEKVEHWGYQNQIAQGTVDSVIDEYRAKAVGQWIENDLKKAQINKTNEEITEIKNNIKQKWQQVSQGWESLSIQEKQLAINKFKEEITAEYPSIWNVGGSVAKKAYLTLENLEKWLLGEKDSRRPIINKVD